MPIYQTKGVLTGTIDQSNVAEAQEYLQFDYNHETGERDKPINMHQYLDPPLDGVVLHLQWVLAANGHDYTVTAVTSRDLTTDELKQLSSEVSGQNSDGLGEGFEQQDFCWDPDGDCHECEGCENGYECENQGGSMISFDWRSNDLPWTKIG